MKHVSFYFYFFILHLPLNYREKLNFLPLYGCLWTSWKHWLWKVDREGKALLSLAFPLRQLAPPGRRRTRVFLPFLLFFLLTDGSLPLPRKSGRGRFDFQLAFWQKRTSSSESSFDSFWEVYFHLRGILNYDQLKDKTTKLRSKRPT